MVQVKSSLQGRKFDLKWQTRRGIWKRMLSKQDGQVYRDIYYKAPWRMDVGTRGTCGNSKFGCTVAKIMVPFFLCCCYLSGRQEGAGDWG